MLGVEVFQKAYTDLAHRYSGLTSDIYLVPPEKMSEGIDLLDCYQVEFDEKLLFQDESTSLDGYGMEGAGGVTINFLRKGEGRSAIFINENALEKGTREDLVWLWRYNSLHHELMHALDFSKQKNFDTPRRTMDLVAAEAFADQKTLLHLKSKSSNGYMKIALQQYALNTMSVGSRGGIRSEIFQRLLLKIDRKTLEYWAFMDA